MADREAKQLASIIDTIYQNNHKSDLIEIITNHDVHELVSELSRKELRLLSIYYNKHENELTYLFLTDMKSKNGRAKIINISKRMSSLKKIRSIQTSFPLSSIFEYELYNQREIIIETDREINRFSHLLNWKDMRRKDVKNPVNIFGNEHQQIQFELFIDDSIIEDVNLSIDLNYRSIENVLIENSQDKIPKLIRNICGMCSSAHQIAFIHCLEELSDVQDQITDDIKGSRIFIAELERAINHLLWVAMSLHELGTTEWFRQLWQIRQKLNQIKTDIRGDDPELISYMANPLSFDGKTDKIRKELKTQFKALQTAMGGILQEKTVRQLQGQGELNADLAKKYQAVGPLARSTGVECDIRTSRPYLLYKDYKKKTIKLNEGDLYASMLVKLMETEEALEICQELLGQLETTENLTVDPPKLQERKVHHIVEAPAGMLTYSTTVDEDSEFVDINITIPTIINIPSLLRRLIHQDVKYLPLLLKGIEMGIDPLDQVKFVNIHDSSSKRFTGQEFRRLCTEHITQHSDLVVFGTR